MNLRNMLLTLVTSAAPFAATTAMAHGTHEHHAPAPAHYNSTDEIRAERLRLNNEYYERHSQYHARIQSEEALDNARGINRAAERSAEHQRWHDAETAKLTASLAALDRAEARLAAPVEPEYRRWERERRERDWRAARERELASWHERERLAQIERERLAREERERAMRVAAEREWQKELARREAARERQLREDGARQARLERERDLERRKRELREARLARRGRPGWQVAVRF